MPIQAILYDGTRLEFPDGTDQEVIDRVAREETEKRRPVAFEQPAPSRPPTERTWGEAAKDVAASAITGAGSLVAAPGQLISLVPGLTGVGQALATPGEMISKAGEDLKSIGLKTREALRSEALSEAEKDGIIAQFATAIKSTITDPALLTSFLSEQVPLLLGPAVAVKVTQLLGRGAIAAAGRGLTGVAAKEAQDVAAQQVAKTATRAAIGTGAAMQAADISSDAYQTAYQKALLQGKPEDQAQEEALNAARIAGAGAGAASLATAGLLGRIGGTAIERKLAGIPGAGRPISMFGEATSEGLEESAGQIFKNIGVRQVDPTQSLTEGVGAAAGLGVLGGAFFGGLLGGRTEPPLAPGQRPGETLAQTANRLNAEIALLNQQISPPSPERPFLDDKELFALAAQPNGSLKLIEYSEQLRQMPQSDERDKAIKDALTLYTQKVIEEKARKTPEDKEYPHAQELPETKAPIPYPSFNQLVTMVSKIGDAKQAVQELDQYAASIKNLPDSPEKTDHLKSVAELKKIVQTEAAARQPKGGPEPFVIKSFDLNQQGITRSDPLHHQIVGKNISNAEDYEYVLRQLEKALDRPKLSPAKYAAIEGLIDALEANLERIEGSGFYARPTVYEPIGAGAGVVSGDVGQPATKRPAKPKRPRVAGTQEYLGAPVSGEAAEPTALEGFPPYVEGPEPGLELEEFPPPGAEEAAKELRRMEREVRRLTYRPTPNLFNVLSGRLDRQEVLDIGSSKGQVEVPYRGLIAKNQRGVIIGDLVGEGTLDQFLPFDMRSDHPKFDAIDAAEFIKEKLRNRDHLTEEASQALARLNLSISDIAEQVTAYELEKLLREANAQLQTEFEEQRKRDQEGEISATEIAYRDLEGGAGEAAFTTERPLVKKDPFTIDVEARVISDVIERNVAALDPRKIQKLEAAYGMSSGTAEAFSDKFLKRIQKDLEILDTQGRLAIESSIRGTIGPLLAKVKPEVKRLAKEPLTIDVEARVIETTIGRQVKALPSPDVVKLENHYGVKAGSKEFLQKVKEDVVLFATKGAKAVASAIRSVIKAIHSGVLSVALVFNPININPPEAYAIVPKAPPVEAAKTTEAKAIELAQVPESVQGMSDAAKQAYQTLIPSLDGKIGDKLIVIADKPSGRMFVFTSDGKLVTQNKALYGAAKGDLYKGNVDVPANRVTPAGLFGLKLVDAAKGGAAKVTAGEYEFGKVFALEDPEAVITIMHSVWLKEADAPRRQAALANQDPEDSRYSFGCINVDKDTYKFLLDNYQAQMDGAKLFVVPDNQAQVKEFLSGQIAQNLGGKKPGEGPDRLVREAVVKKSLRDVTKGVPEAKFKELEQRAKKPREEQKEVAAPKADEAPEVTALKAQKALKVSQLQNVLKKILGQYGLQNVDLNLEEGMQNEGSYSGLLIKLALDNIDPVRVLRHESVHALKELGFFTPQQWKVLTDRANKEWIDTFLKNRNIDGLPLEPGQQSRYDAYMKEYKGDEEAVMEEAIADAFAYFRGTKAPAGMMSAILNRMSNLFKAIQRAMNLGGYNTAEDVFGAIEKGKLKPTAPVSQAEAKASLRGARLFFTDRYVTPNIIDNKQYGWKFKNPVTLKDGTRLSGFSDNAQTTFGGYEKGRILITQRVSTVDPEDIVSSRDSNRTAEALKEALRTTREQEIEKLSLRSREVPQDSAKAFFKAAEKLPRTKGIEAVEEAWSGGVADFGDRDAANYLGQMPGYSKYASELEALAWEHLAGGLYNKDKTVNQEAVDRDGRFYVYRYGDLNLVDEINEGSYEGRFEAKSTTLSINFAKAFANFAAFDEEVGVNRGWMRMAVKPEAVLMVGSKPSEMELVVDLGNVESGTAEAIDKTFQPESPEARFSLRSPTTPEFKRWFGDSKVVDENGDPLVVYHGTTQSFNEFTNDKKEHRSGNPDGFYFTPDADEASDYALTGKTEEGANVIAAYLSIKDPFIKGSFVSQKMKAQFEKELRQDNPNLGDDWIQEKVAVFEERAQNRNKWFPEMFPAISFPTEAMTRVLKAGGYDGFKDGRHWIAIEPNQIKSATGNVGAYRQRPITAEEAKRFGMTEEEAAEAQKRGDIRFSLRSQGQPVTRENVMASMLIAQSQEPFMNCQLCVQMATGVSKLRDLPKVKTAIIGDIYTFNETKDMASHYAIDVGDGNVAEIEAWGEEVRVIPLADVIAEYDEPSAIRRPPDTAYTGSLKFSLRTKTPEFQFWFGQSKIVDDEGQPKVMYHGTGKEYEILGTARRQAKAIFVTDDPKFAEQFAKDTFAKAAVEAAQGVGISPESYKRGVDRAIAAVRKDYGNRPEGKEMIAGIRLGYNDANAEAQEYMRNAFKGELPAGPNIIPVYVKADNPFDYENADHVKQIKSLTATLSGVLEDSPSHLTMMNNIAKGNWEVIEKISVQEAIRTLGFDGFYVKEQGRKSLAVYEPNQLKSVFNDKPTTRPELRLSLRTMPTLAQDVTNRVSQTIAPRIRPGYLERIQDALTPKGFSWFRKEFVNKYEAEARNDRAVAEQIRLMGGTEQLADVKSESAALASDLGGGLAAAAFGVHDRRGGYPVYKKRYLVEKDFLQLGTYQTRAAAEQAARRVGAEVFEIGHTVISNEGDVEGLIAIYSPLMKYKKPAPGEPDVFSLYQFWADVKRASRYIYNPGTGKYTEKLFNDPNDIKRAKEIEQQYPEFKDIHAKWIKYNDKLVDFMRDTGVISAQGAIEMKAHGDYFPFYRHLGENDVQGPKLFSSISGVRAPKAAKGSEAEVTDFFETVVRNTQSAIQAGIKNIAARRATDQALRLNSVQRVQGVATGPAAYRVLEDGKEVYYEADDLMFVESLKSLNQTDIPGLNFVAFPAQLLRALVTKDPAFMLANMMRDSVSAWQTSGVKITPIVSTLKQFANALSGTSPELQALLNAGVVGGYDYSRGVEKSAKELEAEMRKQAKALTTLEKITSLPRSLWGALEKGSAASDAATRMEIYKKVLAETNNEAEALWQSLEVMNFNRKGRSPIIRILTAAVPFLNARIQGLDVLYRSGIRPGLAADSTEAEQQRFRTFWKRGVMMMGLAGAYWALTHDDDEYKKQEQETRDNYWLIPSLGIKIPIAFEVGFMFKVVPERILQLFFGSDTGEEFLKSMGRQLHSTFGVGLPQIINPAVEVAANFSFFTQRNIVGQGLEGVAPKYQVGPNTSSLSAIIGQSLNISPTKLDHLFQGYFGTLGMYAVSLVDSAIEMTSDAPKPAKRLEQMPVIKRFLVDPEARGSVTAYYDMKNSVDEVVRTSNYLMRSGDFASYSEYMRDNIRMLAIKDYINDLEKTMKEFREMKNTIRISSSDAETKRDALISIGKLEQNVTKNIQYLKSLLK